MTFIEPHQVSSDFRVVELDSFDEMCVRSLLEEVTVADGVEPFGEAFVRGLADPSFGHRHFAVVNANSKAAVDTDQLVAFGAVADDAIEIAVAPASRRRGVATLLLHGIDAAVGDFLPVWAHGNVPGAQELATACSREKIRQLLQMTVEGETLRGVAAGVEKRDDFELVDLTEAERRWGRDAVDEAWLRVNNEAFDWHPEQGGWSLEDLNRGRGVNWFDPHGVLFAVAKSASSRPDNGAGSVEDIVGFHWTKWHAAEEVPTGEVYVIGLARAAQGQGLGAWLTAAGLQWLVKQGAKRVLLYVEGDNTAAVKTYEHLGFAVTREDVMYGVSNKS